VQGWRYETQLADQALLHQQDLATISNAAAAQARNALEKQQAAEQALHNFDTIRLKERGQMTSMKMTACAALC